MIAETLRRIDPTAKNIMKDEIDDSTRVALISYSLLLQA